MENAAAFEGLRYSIFDPTGNVTALVETPVAVSAQPAAAAAIMRRCPAVEQVGFVRLFPAGEQGIDAALRMAGGEFCGNASMSTAALLLLRRGEQTTEEKTVRLRVSGAAEPVEVRLRREGADSYRAGVRIPRAKAIAGQAFAFGELRGSLPLVRMEGISHLVITPDSCFFPLKDRPAQAEKAVRLWCGALRADGLGLMFLEEDALTPLVYVPGSGTVFWENSCASGSAAVGMALAAGRGEALRLTLREPGGALAVESDPDGRTWLWGRTRLVEEQ